MKLHNLHNSKDSRIYMVAYLWPGDFKGFPEPYDTDYDMKAPIPELATLGNYFNPDHIWVDSIIDSPDREWIKVLRSQYETDFTNVRIIDKNIQYHKAKGDFEGQKNKPLQDDRGTNPLCKLSFVADVNLHELIQSFNVGHSQHNLSPLAIKDILTSMRNGELKILKSNHGSHDQILQKLEKMS